MSRSVVNVRKWIVIVVIFLLYLIIEFTFRNRYVTDSHPYYKTKHVKHILFWTKWWKKNNFDFGEGMDPFITANCPEWSCVVTHDRTAMPVENFDALIFHPVEFKERDLPKKRRLHQRYIFHQLEAPPHPFYHMPYEKYQNFFNWTMTPLKESDIPRLYNWMSPIDSDSAVHDQPKTWITPSETELNNLSRTANFTKTKTVAWFVSHCNTNSRREDYVKELQKYINVDVFGKCSKKECGERQNQDCYDMVERDYWFYLSFENALCDDYVTEKLFNVLERRVVPVVYGGADYRKVVPPNSVLDVSDFESPFHLAQKMKLLINDPGEYSRFFWWKPYYKSHDSRKSVTASFCQLCQMLHMDLPAKSYQNMNDFYGVEARCHKPEDHPGFKHIDR